jgi:hypothetical protein
MSAATSKQTASSVDAQISSIQSFLVHPGKNEINAHEISGTIVSMTGVLFETLRQVFAKAEIECQHEIYFTAGEDGKQQNVCRDLLLDYVKNSDIEYGREIAKRLQEVSTHRSGLGLLFLMSGHHNGEIKLVVSRFPADSGILAEERQEGLTVAFLERIFMKSAASYKSVVYSGTSFDRDFWKGKAVDKQINSTESFISDYWIKEFLLSDFLTPGEAGTRRLAIAVRAAMNGTNDPKVKADIIGLGQLLSGMPKNVVNAKEILDRFLFSEETKQEIKNSFPRAKSFEENFEFVSSEFRKHVSLRTVELDNGGLLTADVERFNEVFSSDTIDPDDGVVRFSTQGRIIDQRFRRVKP